MKRNNWLSKDIITKLMDKNRQGWTKEPIARIFNSHGSQSWELAWIEDDGDTAYGFCDMGHREFGSFSISELKNLPYTTGMALEIDQSFEDSWEKEDS